MRPDSRQSSGPPPSGPFTFITKEISTMSTYPVNFCNDRQWACRDFDAETPEQALELARQFATERRDDLDLDYYDACNTPISEIEVVDDNGDPLATWYDDDLRLRLAAPDLLTAAEAVLAAWDRGDLASAVRELNVAVAQAKGGAA
jgi:hypothetical protein